MPLNTQQQERLRNALRRMTQTAEFAVLRQFIVSETAEDDPDYAALRRSIVDGFGAEVDEAISNARRIRATRG